MYRIPPKTFPPNGPGILGGGTFSGGGEFSEGGKVVPTTGGGSLEPEWHSPSVGGGSGGGGAASGARRENGRRGSQEEENGNKTVAILAQGASRFGEERFSLTGNRPKVEPAGKFVCGTVFFGGSFCMDTVP